MGSARVPRRTSITTSVSVTQSTLLGVSALCVSAGVPGSLGAHLAWVWAGETYSTRIAVAPRGRAGRRRRRREPPRGRSSVEQGTGQAPRAQSTPGSCLRAPSERQWPRAGRRSGRSECGWILAYTAQYTALRPASSPSATPAPAGNVERFTCAFEHGTIDELAHRDGRREDICLRFSRKAPQQRDIWIAPQHRGNRVGVEQVRHASIERRGAAGAGAPA